MTRSLGRPQVVAVSLGIVGAAVAVWPLLGRWLPESAGLPVRVLVAACILVATLLVAITLARRLAGSAALRGTSDERVHNKAASVVGRLGLSRAESWLRVPHVRVILAWIAGALAATTILAVSSQAGVRFLQGAGHPTSPVAGSGTEGVLFFDDFTEPPESGINLVGDPDWHEEWTAVADEDGNHRLCSSGGENFDYTSVWPLDTDAWSDYRFDVLYRLGDCPDPKAGIFVRENRQGSYLFSLEPAAVGLDWYYDYPYNAPPGDELVDSVQVILPADEWHSATVVAIGPKLSVFVDGEFVLAYTDGGDGFGGSGSGGVGMTAGAECVVCFDDVRVVNLTANGDD